MKAVNVKVIDVRKVTDVADCMVLASGTSDRHVRSIADRVVERAKAGGFRPMGIEGERDGEWVLVDLNDVIVHVMLPRVREFYGLEEPVGAAAGARPSREPRPKRQSQALPAKRARPLRSEPAQGGRRRASPQAAPAVREAARHARQLRGHRRACASR